MFALNAVPRCPTAIRSREAVAKIKEESDGRVDITFYPSSVLGQDTAMMSQAIAGALEIYGMSFDILAQKSRPQLPSGSASPFLNYEVAWRAMDGDLGTYCRGLSEKAGLYYMDKAFDHGFREITMKSKPIDTPDDLKGVKIRLPVAHLFIALFRHLGASPTPINFGEVYSALQTGLVDGQENPLILIDTAKLYEVQKYCSMTNHIWVGLHISFNTAAWKRLPDAVSATSPTKVSLPRRVGSNGSGSPTDMPNGVAFTTRRYPAGSSSRRSIVKLGKCRRRRPREALGRYSADIAQRDRARPLYGNRSGDCRADPAGPDDQTIRASKVEALALCPAYKANAVEQVAVERAVRTAKDGIAGAGHLHCQ